MAEADGLSGEEFWIYPVDDGETEIGPDCYIICAKDLTEAIQEVRHEEGITSDKTFFVLGLGFVESTGDGSGRVPVWDEGLWDKDLHHLVYEFMQNIEWRLNHTQVCNDLLQDLVVEMHEEIVGLTGRNTRPWLKNYLEVTGRKD